jgi:hypothetical protein
MSYLNRFLIIIIPIFQCSMLYIAGLTDFNSIREAITMWLSSYVGRTGGPNYYSPNNTLAVFKGWNCWNISWRAKKLNSVYICQIY